MEAKVNFNVLDVIEKVHNHSKDSQLRNELFDVLKEDLKLLSDYFQLNEIQTVIFANCFILGYEETYLGSVFKHFGMKEYKAIKYKKDIDLLNSRNFFKERRRHRRIEFEISRAIINAVSENIRFNSEDTKPKNLITILEEFDLYSDLFDDDEISQNELKYKIQELLDDNSEISFIKIILDWKLDEFETFFFLDTLWDAIKSGDNDFNTGVQSTIDDFFKDKGSGLLFQNQLLNGKTKLTKIKLIELSKDSYRNSCKAKLSKNIIELLKEKENIILEFGEDKSLIYAENIKEKPLFYGESELSQIQTVSKMLENEQFLSIQNRLKEKAMPVGFSILLYGAPGTGKTESVYQLARESGRNIMKVDISETKSMWFGESQKLAKKIFTQYKELKETEELCPILLLNEADAIIGKRKQAGSSNVADTENAIQNVFLEELENFDGILFATTNLVNNMDNAFERRFLYKIQFQKPSIEQSVLIWKSKLPFLNDEECKKLAEQYLFSGGEMENIARKTFTNEILTGETPDFEYVKNICQNEKWNSKEIKKIGF